MRSARRALVLSLVTLAVSACGGAGHGRDADDRSSDPPGAGERSGVIVDIGPAPDFDQAIDQTCRRFAKTDSAADRRYATVRFYSGRHAHTRVLPIASAFRAEIGDRVVFRSSGCAEIDRR